MLDKLLAEYNDLQVKESEISEKKSQLKEEILNELASIGKSDYLTTDGSLKANVATKTTFKYTDEIGIINYLQDNGMSSFLKTTIDTSAFNKTLKSSQTLQESLSGKFTRSEAPALTVKRV